MIVGNRASTCCGSLWVRIAATTALVGCTLLSGCSGEPSPAALTPVSGPSAVSAAQTATKQDRTTFLVATNRTFDATTGAYGGGRAYDTTFAQFTFQFPPTHQPGQMEFPNESAPDPNTQIVTVGRTELDAGQFRAQTRTLASGNGEVMVFVHGYNTTYQYAAFRLAQLCHDSGFAGACVLFTWPSAGKALGYPHDRDSAMFSRDALEAMLLSLASTPGVRKIHILAHSMGNLLTVETLLQAKRQGVMELGGKLGQVGLASADIDVNVFTKEIQDIGRHNPPFVLFVSHNDKALAVSSALADDTRVGDVVVSDPGVRQAVEKAGVVVIDMSELANAGTMGHSAYATDGPMVQAFGRYLNAFQDEPHHGGSGLVVVDAAGKALGAIGNAFQGGQ